MNAVVLTVAIPYDSEESRDRAMALAYIVENVAEEEAREEGVTTKIQTKVEHTAI